MKCPTCGAWSLVKETRQSPTFGQTRRRECANEHRFTTQEVIIPQEVIDEERRTHIEVVAITINTNHVERVSKEPITLFDLCFLDLIRFFEFVKYYFTFILVYLHPFAIRTFT